MNSATAKDWQKYIRMLEVVELVKLPTIAASHVDIRICRIYGRLRVCFERNSEQEKTNAVVGSCLQRAVAQSEHVKEGGSYTPPPPPPPPCPTGTWAGILKFRSGANGNRTSEVGESVQAKRDAVRNVRVSGKEVTQKRHRPARHVSSHSTLCDLRDDLQVAVSYCASSPTVSVALTCSRTPSGFPRLFEWPFKIVAVAEKG